MLKIFGTQSDRDCDGFTRRNFMQIGSLAMGGLALPQLLQAEAKAGAAAQRQKSVIMIFLAGGPSHLDMWDIKEDAPLEYRGEFNAIPTSVPGVRICEHFPKLAKMWDKCAAKIATLCAPMLQTYRKYTGIFIKSQTRMSRRKIRSSKMHRDSHDGAIQNIAFRHGRNRGQNHLAPPHPTSQNTDCGIAATCVPRGEGIYNTS